MRDRLRVVVLFLIVGWLGLAASSARAETAPSEASAEHASLGSTPTYHYYSHERSSTLFPASHSASNDNTAGVAFAGIVLLFAAGALVYPIGAGVQRLLGGSGSQD